MLDSANIAIPENIAVAVNTYCTNCFTYAVAMQLIVTIPDELTDEKIAELMEIWGRVQKVKENIGDILDSFDTKGSSKSASGGLGDMLDNVLGKRG